MRNPRRQTLGFTLVEMLVVIVVVGILATIAVFAIRGINDRGEGSACGADARTLQTAAQTYLAQEPVTTIPATGADADRYERTLVDAELLKQVSTKYDMDADGNVSTTGQPCT